MLQWLKYYKKSRDKKKKKSLFYNILFSYEFYFFLNFDCYFWVYKQFFIGTNALHLC